MRAKLNGGIGGYVSQKRLCKRVRPCAPTTDAELIPVLCDLLTVSSPQLHELLRRDLDKLTTAQPVEKEFFRRGQSLGTFQGVVTKRFVCVSSMSTLSMCCVYEINARCGRVHVIRYDDNNNFQITYSDGDREDLDFEELLDVLKCSRERLRLISSAYTDLVATLDESKKPDRNEYLFHNVLVKKPVTWFGPTLEDRRKLSCSLTNFCVFRHDVSTCKCEHGVNPWVRATADMPCVFRHDPMVCKCNQIAIKLSQDECSYAAYMLQKREWRVGAKHAIRKKAPGPPLMISDYASFEFGLGVKVSPAILNEINRLRAAGPEDYSVTTEDDDRIKKKTA